MSASSELPRRYGDYLLIEQVGKGGMAEVFRAERLGAAGFSREVAVKRMLPRYGDDAHFNQRFLEEAKLVSGLVHRNIVQTLDLGHAEGTYFIAMELVRGRDLRELQRALFELDEPMPIEVAVYVTLEILRGLHYAHEHRQRDGSPLDLIHRDISPSNVLLSFSGDVKLCDFGIAKAANLGDVTRTGIIKGKVPYLAPEALHPDGGPVDRRVDVYAVGLVLFELLTGRRALRGADAPAIIDAILHRELPSLRAQRADVPEAIEEVYRRGTARDPAQRFESAEAMRAELARVSTGSGASPETLTRLLRRLFPEAISQGSGFDPALEPQLERLRSAARAVGPAEPDRGDAPTVELPGRGVDAGPSPTGDEDPLSSEPPPSTRSRPRPWPAALAAILVLAAVGWAGWYRAGPAALRVTSAPAGADVRVNGAIVGEAPVFVAELDPVVWHDVECSWSDIGASGAAGDAVSRTRIRCPSRATCRVTCERPRKR